MIRLLYFSQAMNAMSDEDVQGILHISRRNNSAIGITGVLIYGGGLFMQVLEGPEHSVLKKYVKIIDDKRHTNCQIIYITPTNKRIFEGWSMGMISCGHSFEFEHILELRNQRKEVIRDKVFKDAMSEFLRRLKADP
ncbi:MAG: BLUF domain-containing protein [Methylobacter sp.]